jgi:putative NADPH-quinone reductase
MSKDNEARLREFIDRVLTAGEIDATGDYSHGDVGGSTVFRAGTWAARARHTAVRPLHDHRHRAHHLVGPYRKPPDATRLSPVIHPESSEARNTATRATSSGCPKRLSGVCATICFSMSLPMIPIR